MKNIALMSQGFLERNLIPDPVIRFGIRGLLKSKLKNEGRGGVAAAQQRLKEVVEEMKSSTIALNTTEANQQHYEVPTEFFRYVMGKHMKYSCGYWKKGVTDFDQSEEDMLFLTCGRADLCDGQDVLDLGCGWGSLTLYMAEKFPGSRITGVSNSRTQKEYIEDQAKARGLTNVTIRTADMNDFEAPGRYDRVVSIEMFEHMRNYKELLQRIAGWLKDDGKLFIHIFTHRKYTYFYTVDDGGYDWMARYFFTGGIMPSDDLLYHFQDDFAIAEHWQVPGTHYQKTSEGWLRNMDAHKVEIMPILRQTYGEQEYRKWWVYWRVFFMACAELWGYDNGREWLVSHYQLKKKVKHG